MEAQSSSTGALTVVVQDSTGAVIPGATVTVANDSNARRSDTTNANGSFTFTLLPPSDYTVTISAAGFNIYKGTGIQVHVAETAVLEERMQVGVQQQQVEVTAQTAAIQ